MTLIKYIMPPKAVYLMFYFGMLLVFEALAQPYDIKGLVSDQQGKPLSGVIIREKGTDYATISLNNGSFEFSVTSLNAVLSFTLEGYYSLDDSIGGREVLAITLQKFVLKDTVSANQPVNLGFYTWNASHISSSTDVFQVDNDNQGTLHLSDMLNHLSGMDVYRSGEPTGYFLTTARGIESPWNEEPLFVVDGIVMNMGINLPAQFNRLQPFTSINPQDIRNIRVLKSNSATAVYGSQGANGVILISTKRVEKAQPLRVKFSVQSGISVPAVKNNLLEAPGYFSVLNRSLENAGREPIGTNFNESSKTWYNDVVKTGVQNKLSFVLSGKNTKSEHYLSAVLEQVNGIVVNSGFNNKSLFYSLHRKIADWFGFNLLLNTSAADNAVPLNGFNRFDANPLVFAQMYPPVEEDVVVNTPLLSAAFGPKNPADVFNERFAKNSGVHHLGKLDFDFRINKNLTFNSVVSSNYSDLQMESLYPGPQKLVNQKNISSVYNWYVNNYATWESFIGNHHLLIVGGSSENFQKLTDNLTIHGERNEVEIIPVNYIGKNSRRTGALFLHGNYAFKSRFDVSAGIRRENILHQRGSNLYGLFPSFSAGVWIFKSDDLHERQWFSGVKLNTGWGISGADKLLNLHYEPQYQPDNLAVDFMPEEISAGTPLPNARWETSEEWNFGIQTLWLNDALSLNLDYFDRMRSDVFLARKVLNETGDVVPGWDYSGRIKNTGWELVASYRRKLGEIALFAKLNVQSFAAEILELSNGIDEIEYFGAADITGNMPVSVLQKGESPAAFMGYVYDGIFQSQQEVDLANQQDGNPETFYQSRLTEPGDVRFKDLDGNGFVDEKDRAVIGKATPDYSYGITLGLGFKQFDLSGRCNGMTGNQVLNLNTMWTKASGGAGNRDVMLADSWTLSNTASTLPRLHFDDPNENNRPHSGMVEDASFFRLQNLEIGYTFLLNNQQKNLRGYLSLQNVLIQTGYSGNTPEAAVVLGTGITGIDYGQYPRPLTVMLGIQFGL